MRVAVPSERLREVYDRVAHRYDRWHAFVTAGADQRGRRLLVERCVSEGDRVLDSGGGTGRTATLAARAAGASGSVVLLDFSHGMLREAARNLEETPPSGLRLAVGDILELPFEDGSFDVVLSTYSVCPLVDPVEGATEMYRVVRPGGLLGVAHSAEPGNPVAAWLAERVERLVWRWPRLSLGCRAVSVLPRLVDLGGEVVLDRRIGVPLWPFRVFAVRKAGSGPSLRCEGSGTYVFDPPVLPRRTGP